MSELRAPAPHPVRWTAAFHGVPPGALLVDARTARDARYALRMHMQRTGRDGWRWWQTEALTVSEWQGNGGGTVVEVDDG